MISRCCESSHTPADTACRGFLAGMNGRCVYCDHEEKCHPGPGATCEIGRGESGDVQPAAHDNGGSAMTQQKLTWWEWVRVKVLARLQLAEMAGRFVKYVAGVWGGRR